MVGSKQQGRRAAQRAFTLIELLLVLVILAVLAAVVVPRFTNRSEDAKKTRARTDIDGIKTGLKMFEVDNGRFPTSQEGLGALIETPSGMQNTWKGPYLEGGKLPVDPWSNPYQYVSPAGHSKDGYDLFSFGPDGHEGGGDDITNWD